MLQFFNQLDLISQLVLGILFFMSVLCWSIAVYKFIIFRSRVIQLKKAYKLIYNITGLQDFISRLSTLQGTFTGQVTAYYLTGFQEALKSSKEDYWQMLQSYMSQKLDNIVSREESAISMLSTCAQVAPLMGLFGTVWGLISAFSNLESAAVKSSSSIPGIADALFTTLAGLIVAIPALVLFNSLQKKVLIFEHSLVMLTDKCYWTMRFIVDKKSSKSILENQEDPVHVSSINRELETEIS